MRAVLKLEIIGDNYLQQARLIREGKLQMPRPTRRMIDVIRYGRRELHPWVARITPKGREFVESVRDYRAANNIGSRGIFLYYALRPGTYEVNECVRLGKARRYFVRVAGTDYEEIECPAINTISE